MTEEAYRGSIGLRKEGSRSGIGLYYMTEEVYTGKGIGLYFMRHTEEGIGLYYIQREA